MNTVESKPVTSTSWLGALVRVKLPNGKYKVTEVASVLPNYYGIFIEGVPPIHLRRPNMFLKPDDVHLIQKRLWDDPLPDWEVQLVGFNSPPISESCWLEAIDAHTGEYECIGKPQSLGRNFLHSNLVGRYRLKYVSIDPLPSVVWEEIN